LCPFDVALDAELVDGRYECTRLEVSEREDGPPITSNALRTLPVGRLMREAAQISARVRVGASTRRATTGGATLRDGVLRRRPADEDEELLTVALAYRLAHACGEPPTNAVAEQLGIARSTATKKVMAARAAGYLGKTTAGKAGT
jgi:hypothetical protein